MKRLPIIAASVALVAGIGAVVVTSSFTSTAEEDATATDAARNLLPVPKPVDGAKASDDVAVAAESDETSQSDAPDSNEEEDQAMTTETAESEAPEQTDEFKQTMHEGDIALGVCGARVSTLLWFYEASVAQGRDDLQPAVASLKTSRDAIKAEAERRAVDDKVDTSVRVMNSESEKMWEELNEKAGGDADEFQKAHDELYAGVQECLSLFFDRPGDKEEAAPEAEKEG